METFFYVIGAALVVIALIISAVGMRSDNFPSPTMLRVGVLFVALVVAVTGYAAVEASEEEQLHRLEEQNLEADAAEAEQTAENEDIAGEGTPEAEEESPVDGSGQGPADAPTVDAEAGAQVFVDNGCGSCHTLTAQGDNALGEIGPNLDEALLNKDAAYIETSIIDPSAEIAPGFGDGIMPSDFGTQIEPADLDALVAYLQESTSASAK